MSVLAPPAGVVHPAMAARKRIVLISHDNRGADLLEWARRQRDSLARHELLATPNTSAILSRELGLNAVPYRFRSPSGGQHLGATMRDGCVDLVVLFWDALEPLPRDADVTALLRVALENDVPIASTRAAADSVLGASRHEVPSSCRLGPPPHGAPSLRRTRPSPCH